MFRQFGRTNHGQSKEDNMSISNPWVRGGVWKYVQTFTQGIILKALDALPPIVKGQIFLYNDRVYITSTNRRIISRASGVMTTPITVANSTTETTVWSDTVAANSFDAAKVYIFYAYGKFSTMDAAASLTIRFKLNDVTVSSISSTLGVVTDAAGYVKSTMTIRSVGAAGTVSCFSQFQLDAKTESDNDSSITFDTTALGSVKITAQRRQAILLQ